jgi:hypothetical protein
MHSISEQARVSLDGILNVTGMTALSVRVSIA